VVTATGRHRGRVKRTGLCMHRGDGAGIKLTADKIQGNRDNIVKLPGPTAVASECRTWMVVTGR
jgi:hypothetical protein